MCTRGSDRAPACGPSTSPLDVRMPQLHSLFVALAGLSVGGIVGASIPSETERQRRRGAPRWNVFANSTWAGILLNQIIFLVIVGAASLIAGVGILRLGGAYPLDGFDRYLLSGTILVGAAVVKWLRYLFWRSRRVW